MSAPARFAAVAGAIGATYLLGRLGAFALSQPAAFQPSTELAAAALVGVTLAGAGTGLSGGPGRRAVALGLVTWASVAAVMLEGSAFAPTLSPPDQLPVGLVIQAVPIGVTAAVAAGLTPTTVPKPDEVVDGVIGSLWRIVVAAGIYVGAYFATGTITYLLVTGPYYATHAGGLAQPAPAVVLLVAIVEGLLLAAGSIPLARVLTGSPGRRAMTLGLVLWILGGAVPLLQEATLPDVVRLASGIEILTQKGPLGVAVVWLFTVAADRQRGRAPKPARPVRHAPSTREPDRDGDRLHGRESSQTAGFRG